MSLYLGLRVLRPITRTIPYLYSPRFVRFVNYNNQNKTNFPKTRNEPKKLVSSPNQENVYDDEKQANHHFGSLILSKKYEEAMARMDEFVENKHKLSVVTVSKLIQDMSTP